MNNEIFVSLLIFAEATTYVLIVYGLLAAIGDRLTRKRV